MQCFDLLIVLFAFWNVQNPATCKGIAVSICSFVLPLCTLHPSEEINWLFRRRRPREQQHFTWSGASHARTIKPTAIRQLDGMYVCESHFLLLENSKNSCEGRACRDWNSEIILDEVVNNILRQSSPSRQPSSLKMYCLSFPRPQY